MESIEFEHDGRTLTCRSATSRATPGISWWWLDVSGDAQRYAAFRTEPTDTPENLRPRIVAWHSQLLAERARPREVQQRWRRPAPAQKPVAPVGPEFVVSGDATPE